MKLSDLLQFDNIIVQCHDNPDADALASGFGVYEYLRMNGKSPRLVYGGRNIRVVPQSFQKPLSRQHFSCTPPHCRQVHKEF